MRLDCPSERAQSVSPATWVALAALVVVLGSLSLALIGCQVVFPLDEGRARLPECQQDEVLVGEVCVKRFANHYTCQCDCTGFGDTARVAPTALITVYDDPTTQNPLGQTAPSNEGTIVGASQQALLNGVDETWWFVDFDAGADGWVVQSQISIVTGAPLLSKALDVCVVPAHNANLPNGHEPSQAELETDCSTDRVFPHFGELTSQTLPTGAQCGCAVTKVAPDWVAECDAPCSQPSTVCLVAGSDPERPTPDTLSTVLFAPTSVCQVMDGTVSLTIGDTPTSQANVSGAMQIHGWPCPAGQPCQVGLSYQFAADPIEFDLRAILAEVVRFDGITISGATEPGAIILTQSLGADFAGFVPADKALTSVNGRNAGSPDTIAAVIRNSQRAAFAVNWEAKTCRLSGAFGGQVRASGALLTVSADVDINGVIVNQPPLASARVANAAADGKTLECTSPAGALVTLDASGSTDRDDNIAFYIWRRGSDTGPLVGDPSGAPVRNTTQPLGTTTYSVRVVDSELAADTASVTVNVVDTTTPVIDCQAPAAISPPEAAVSFKATATDSCGAPPVVVSDVECQRIKPNGAREDWKSCKVTTQGDTITIANTGGVNGVIRWKARTVDAVGNVAERTCQVNVVSQGKNK